MNPFRKFVFCATDFYLANGIPEWIFLLHGCRTNQINIYSPNKRAARSNHFLVLFLLCFNFLDFFRFFGFPFHTEWNSRMDFPLAQFCSLSRSQRTTKMSCIGNCIKKLWLRSANLYFAQRISIWRTEFQNGLSFLHGCRTNQINIYSQKGGSVKPFFGTFLLCFNFLDFLFTRNGIPEWIFLLYKSEACQISTDTKDELHR